MTHTFPLTVYYEDTDMGGIVYHANYLKFIERARSTWVAELGVDQRALREAGTIFVVRRIESDFLAPATLGDHLTVTTESESQTNARWILRQTVMRGEKTLFDARVTVVAMGLNGRPQRLPAELRAAAASRGAK
ncbi:MAG: tol-pal system-associated acyl-CoA thioesterase [Pseudomonadota bacterium]